MSQSSASSRVGKQLSVAACVRTAISEAKTAGLDIQKIEISTDGVASIITGNSVVGGIRA